jgi:hypothetical protein
VKAFVLVRGKSGRLYLYDRGTWFYMERSKRHEYTFVVDHDNYKVLEQMQALVNKDIQTED